ncbi:hypothetical protein B0T24DRAFT_590510 [Lasiosphaeria ovina]|uniref:Uncharacterized protein n=1 Tax=Lasiosphaeria ovina TaxID=92902 RepID=A0AAE0NEG0_9PEZI|nr:hypothetical protein B0T24DRAFT_590510 [Lasiosphaeria ovina]
MPAAKKNIRVATPQVPTSDIGFAPLAQTSSCQRHFVMRRRQEPKIITTNGVASDASASTSNKRPAPATEEAPAKKPKPFSAEYAKSMIAQFKTKATFCEHEIQRLTNERDHCIKEAAKWQVEMINKVSEEEASATRFVIGYVEGMFDKAVRDFSPGCLPRSKMRWRRRARQLSISTRNRGLKYKFETLWWADLLSLVGDRVRWCKPRQTFVARAYYWAAKSLKPNFVLRKPLHDGRNYHLKYARVYVSYIL